MSHRSREVLILSGDQLYQMDYRKMLDTHRRHVADATVAVLPVTAEQTAGFGILKVNRQGRIVQFEEKPGPERLAGPRVRHPRLRQGLPGLDGHLHVLARGARARQLRPRRSSTSGAT